MFSFSKVTVDQEREFERRNVSGKRESYLRSNPVERFESDPVYHAKVEQLRSGLEAFSGEKPSGWILDLGGNTGGETTVLVQQGFRILLSDINEVALGIARERARRFGLEVPLCVAADVHALPFTGGSFQAVMVIEALHHFDDYEKALAEILRVLEPGGGFMALEPNGWNPLRRLSEIRDRFRGTIEKSFTRGQLFRLLRKAGFESIEVTAVPSGRSSLRMGDVPVYRRWLARGHAWLQQHFPRFFGAYQIRAVKPGSSPGLGPEWPDFLGVPGGVDRVLFGEGRWRAGAHWFPEYEGIPVLIESDRREGGE